MAEERTTRAGGVMAEVSEGAGISRREFLNYAWLASLGIFLLEFGVVGYVFAMPRFRAGEFGGEFPVGRAAELPSTEADPLTQPAGRFWLVRTDQGVLALYRVCTHLGCLYQWAPTENKFLCPCHGSQFQRDGTYILGPAPRNLDQFVVQMRDQTGQVIAETPPAGGPIPVPTSDAIVVVDTGRRIMGKPHG